MCKCVICGKEWLWYEYDIGTKIVEPGMPVTSMCGVDVCLECKPIVGMFHARIDENRRELQHIMQEWYTVKKFDR